MRIPAPNFTQTPNDLFDHWLPHLTEGELKVLLVIMRKTFGWHKKRDRISNSQLSKITGLHEETVRICAKSLCEKGVIIRDVVGENGSQATYYEIVVHEEDSNNSYRADSTGGPGGINPEVSSAAQKKPFRVSNSEEKSPPKEKGNVKAMPIPSEKDQGKTQYPLKKEQLEIFNQLKDLDLKADDDTLKILIRVYGIEKVSDAICHMRAEDFKGTVFKKPRIAFFRHLLSGRTAIRSTRAEENRKRLQIALKKCAWQSLEIHDKYIICRNCMKEISLDLDKKEFDSQLNTLYETSKIYGN